jgi:hypothetical protein
MSIAQLITHLENRLIYLAKVRLSAVEIGDIFQVNLYDAEIADTQTTLNKLRTLV